MKSIKILTMVVLMSFTGMLMAQTGDNGGRESIQFGLKGGANLSNVWDSQTDEFTSDRKLGYVAGAGVQKR